MPKLHVPYLKWREGRPRFEPGPSLRAKGFRGTDLKDARGGWLRTRGQAADAIERILAGQTPATATVAVRTPAAAARGSQQTMSALFAAYRATRKFTGDDPAPGARPTRARVLAETTRTGYASHLRLLEAWCGDVPAASITPQAVQDFYDALCDGRGPAMATAAMRVLKLTFNFAHDRLRWPVDNPVEGLEMVELPGRLVVWTPQEITAAIAAADWCGLPAIGDAIVLSLTTGQIQSGVIALPELRLENGVFAGKRRKTGVPFFVPPLALLTDRIALMRERKARAWTNVEFRHELIGNDGRPYDGSRFRKEFRLVRAIGSGTLFAVEDVLRGLGGLPPKLRNLPFTPQPTLAHKNYADLRDTCITWLMQELKGDLNAVCNIVGLSLATAHAIIDKHYNVRSAEVSAGLTAQLDAAFSRKLGG